jgi:Raf kinase inhibitor-like YbhB/YbcL family protein
MSRSVVATTAAVALGCAAGLMAATGRPDPDKAGPLSVSSPSFEARKPIPAENSCEGGNISPALNWSGAPAGTKSFAVIMDDPDAPAGVWVHWVYYDLPPAISSLPAGVKPVEKPETGGRQGMNSFHQVGYGGPCPPPGRAHRYFFKVYALDKELGLEARASRAEVDNAMAGHILARGQLMGTYQRQ